MAHQIYQTEGIVLKKKNFGEADCLFYLFTEKFGMIKAITKGVRLEKSKLRYGLSLFSIGEFVLIFSKDFWQIIDAKDIKTMFNNRFEKISVFAELANFLTRMIKGEERNDFIWQEVKNFLTVFYNKDISIGEMKDLKTQAIARILNNLGYMKNIPVAKSPLISAINKAIKESML